MSEEEKKSVFADILDMDQSEFSLDTLLAELDNWDSVAMLAFMAMMDERFGKTVKGADIRNFKTVRDAINFME